MLEERSSRSRQQEVMKELRAGGAGEAKGRRHERRGAERRMCWRSRQQELLGMRGMKEHRGGGASCDSAV